MKKYYTLIYFILLTFPCFATTYEVVATETVNNGIINFGDIQIVHGIVNNFTIKGTQNLLDYGKAYNNTITGSQNIYNEGNAFNTVLYNGNLNIYNGGASYNINALNTNIYLYKGSQLNGNSIITNSNIYIFSDNTLDNISLHKAKIISYTENNKPVHLTINNLSGTGQFILTTNINDNPSDILSILQGNGNFGLSLIDISKNQQTDEQINIISKNTQNRVNFYLIGETVDIGAQKYILAQNEDYWYLQETLNYTDTALIAKDTYATLSSILYSHQIGIYDRLGELRFNMKKGLWIKSFGKNIKFNLKHNTQTDIDVYGLQLGNDYTIPSPYFENTKIGISLSYSDTSQKFNFNGKGIGKTYSVALYSTISPTDNSYLDIVGSYYHHKQKLKTYTSSKHLINSNYNLDAYSLSTEFGYSFSLKHGYFIEPQLQGLYTNLDDISYITTLNTKIKGYGIDSTMVRLGIMFGKRWENHAQTYILVDMIKEFDTKSKIKVANTTFHEKLDETFYKISAGFDLNIVSKAHTFAKIGTSFGNNSIKIPIEGIFGIRLNF